MERSHTFGLALSVAMLRSMLEAAALLVTSAVWLPVSATPYGVYAYYAGTSCNGTPYAVYAWEEPACSEGDELACTAAFDGTEGSASGVQMNGICSTDYIATMRSVFSASQYILQVTFNDSGCSVFDQAYGVPATGNCEGSVDESSIFIIGSLDANSTPSIEYFNDSHCQLDSLWWTDTTNSSTLSTHSCDSNAFKWYSSADELDASSSGSSTIKPSSGSTASEGDSSGGLSTGATIGIIVGCVALVIGGIAVVVLYKCRERGKLERQWTAMPSAGTSSLEVAVRGQTGLWNDDVITAKRIPRDKVKIKKLLSRGAYGEVYNGVFNGQKVAVKMLLPATRGNLEHVTDLLTEAKLTASMDHPHIVSFIGVAWDSLSDLCVVLEFMDGGDLRTLLNKYEASKHPVGVDREKATIALHVCHALTYLHSLTPPVIHRDLKSRNILLNQAMEAKLTDFGISRERLDQTMTAGVGTSLWMAPEVMLGENYGVKADMFSFGVVLSELDVHTPPYAQAKKSRKVGLLQKIASGEIRVDFSESSPKSLVELGRACVAVDPDERPTAPEALYRLQVILSQDLQ
jgi:serine/threonine-protein kinase TNNI3K